MRRHRQVRANSGRGSRSRRRRRIRKRWDGYAKSLARLAKGPNWECLAGWWYGVEKPLAKGPSAGAGGGAGAWVWPEAMAAHVGGSHPVAAKVRAASAAAWSAGDA